MASIEEVAHRAGVSIATVSRALRGQSGVSERTRQHVQAVAAELRYTASRSASNLATGRTHCVGVVVPYVARWFFGQVIAGVEAVLRTAGFDLMLYAVADVDARKRFFHELPLRRGVDAVLVLSLPLIEQEVEALRSLNVPVGLLGSEAEGFTSVRIDDRYGASLAVRHLINLGHRDIALIYGVVDELYGFADDRRFMPPRERHAAYIDVLTSQGIEVHEDMQAEGGHRIAEGERAMDRLLAARTRPTAVFAHTDEMAMGALRSLGRHGLTVPHDISIVGFDGHELCDFLDLTTVAQPVHEQGATAARLLLEQLESGGSVPPRKLVLPVDLVVRGSTAPRRDE